MEGLVLEMEGLVLEMEGPVLEMASPISEMGLPFPKPDDVAPVCRSRCWTGSLYAIINIIEPPSFKQARKRAKHSLSA